MPVGTLTSHTLVLTHWLSLGSTYGIQAGLVASVAHKQNGTNRDEIKRENFTNRVNFVTNRDAVLEK